MSLVTRIAIYSTIVFTVLLFNRIRAFRPFIRYAVNQDFLCLAISLLKPVSQHFGLDFTSPIARHRVWLFPRKAGKPPTAVTVLKTDSGRFDETRPNY